MKIKSIKTKLTLSITGLILFFGLLATTSTYFYSREVLTSLKEQEFLHSTYISTHEIVSILSQSALLAKTVAENKNVVEIMSNLNLVNDNSMSYRSIVEYDLLNNFNIGNHYSAIYLIDKTGKTLVSTDETFVGKNYDFRDYFKSAISGTPYVDVSIGVTSRQLGYYFSHPIRSASGEVLGVAVVKQESELIDNSVAHEIREHEKMMLVDKFGVVIYSNDPKKIFKSLGVLTMENQALITQGKRYADFEVKPLGYDEVLASLNDFKQAYSLLIKDDFDQENEILAVAKIGDFPFYLIGETNVEIAEQFASKNSLIISGFVILAALIVAILVFLLTNIFLNPISELTNAVEAIIDGDITKRADVKSGDELEKLSDSFNLMTDKLVDAQTTVEQKIVERTRQLERLNKSMVGRELKMIELKKQLAKKEGKNA